MIIKGSIRSAVLWQKWVNYSKIYLYNSYKTYSIKKKFSRICFLCNWYETEYSTFYPALLFLNNLDEFNTKMYVSHKIWIHITYSIDLTIYKHRHHICIVVNKIATLWNSLWIMTDLNEILIIQRFYFFLNDPFFYNHITCI
jgi:hypothetical protein